MKDSTLENTVEESESKPDIKTKNDIQKAEKKNNLSLSDENNSEQEVKPDPDREPENNTQKEETKSNKTTSSPIESNSEMKESTFENTVEELESETDIKTENDTQKVEKKNSQENLSAKKPNIRSLQYVTSNVYYDINIGDTKFAPYISIGAGTGILNNNFYFVIQGKLGMNYQLTDRMQLSTGYRLLSAVSSDFNSNFFGANNIEVGLAFNF